MAEAILVGVVAPCSVVAKVLRVHDGDSLTVTVPDWPAIVGKGLGIRLFGVDAPELRDPRPAVRAQAVKAHQRLVQLLETATVTLVLMARDKYFRLDAQVQLPDGREVTAVMLTEGLVKPYSGHGPKPW